MDEALKKITDKLRESRPASPIDDLLPLVADMGISAEANLGIEHYGKVSTVVEAQAPEPQPARPAEPGPQDAASKIAAGSRELSLEELSSPPQIAGEIVLKPSQLGGSRFHEISLEDLSRPVGEEEKAS